MIRKPPKRDPKVRSAAYTLTTADPDVVLTVSETPDRNRITLSVRSLRGRTDLPREVSLNYEQWDALNDLRYSLELEKDAEAPVIEPATPEEPLEPAERRIEVKCPDNLSPGGPSCPRCGNPRGPSGADGGSWVHMPLTDKDEEIPF